MANNYTGCNPQTLGEERDRLREALVKIQKRCDELDEGDAYSDLDSLQVFENDVSDIVEIALAKSA